MEDFFQDGFKPTIGLTIGATACGAGKPDVKSSREE